MLKIEHLSFTYPEQTDPALRDVNLTVRQGDFFVLCGHSGCGKSTLLRQLKPRIAPHGSRSGNITFLGADLSELSDEESAARIGFVMQSPETQIVTDKVWHELAFGLESLGCETSVIRRRCAEMAAFFGIEDWYHRNVSELSGGQKQLLCLASVMTLSPDILILDEPTAQLDPVAASEFISTLGKINRELGTTVLLSEHRLEETFALATGAAVLENGSILCCGTVSEVGEFLKESDNRMFSAMPCAMQIWGSVESTLPCPVTVRDGRSFLQDYLADHEKKCLPEKTAGTASGREMLRVQGAWFRYERNGPDVVRGLNYAAHAGELCCILGGNGSGKTTMLKLLSGEAQPLRGEITLHGRVAMLPQNPCMVFLKNTVREDLEDLLSLRKVPGEEWTEEIRKVSQLCGIGELLSRHPYDLSGGEQQKAALAKTLLTNPDILLLDEPTKGLDVPFRQSFSGILRKLCNRGVCVVMVSHDPELCASCADRCALFFDGHLVTEAPPEEFFGGNSFYTTAANRLAREREPRAVTTGDVIRILGGTLPPEEHIVEKAPEFQQIAEETLVPSPLPRWRKAGALVSALAALGMLFYSAGSGNLSSLVGIGGVTSAGIGQLAYYGVFLMLLGISAVFLGRRSAPPVNIQTPEQKRRISKRTLIASVMILLLVPLTLFIGVFYLSHKQYYLTALAVLVECMLPFFLIFEDRKPRARELVLIASVCAIAIAGRAAFFMLPQFKPVMAVTIIAGVALGGETGFLVGAVTMLVSNVLFSQGPWTPWQMFAMGIIGFLAGVLFRKGLLLRTRGSLCTFGVLCAFLIYGGIMNPASAFIWGGENLNGKILLAYYVTGFPMDAVHAAATFLFLWFGAEPMLEKLERIKTKYGLVE